MNSMNSPGSGGQGNSGGGGAFSQSPSSKFGAGGSVHSPTTFSAGNSSPYAVAATSNAVSASVPSAPASPDTPVPMQALNQILLT